MSSAFPPGYGFPPRLPKSSLNSREELWREEATFVAWCENYAICGKLEFVARIQSSLEVDVNEYVGGVPHSCTGISDLAS